MAEAGATECRLPFLRCCSSTTTLLPEKPLSRAAAGFRGSVRGCAPSRRRGSAADRHRRRRSGAENRAGAAHPPAGVRQHQSMPKGSFRRARRATAGLAPQARKRVGTLTWAKAGTVRRQCGAAFRQAGSGQRLPQKKNPAGTGSRRVRFQRSEDPIRRRSRGTIRTRWPRLGPAPASCTRSTTSPRCRASARRQG